MGKGLTKMFYLKKQQIFVIAAVAYGKVVGLER